MRVGTVQAGLGAVVLTLQFSDRRGSSAEPKTDLLWAGAEYNVRNALDVLALCGE